jgi:hypothetical protein
MKKLIFLFFMISGCMVDETIYETYLIDKPECNFSKISLRGIYGGFNSFNPGVVSIKVGNNNGSGVVIGSRTVLTVKHYDYDSGFRVFDYNGDFLGNSYKQIKNKNEDLMILIMENDLGIEPIPINYSYKYQEDECNHAYFIGYGRSEDSGQKLGYGYIDYEQKRDYTVVPYSDHPMSICYGDSGGGLFDSLGNLLGITIKGSSYASGVCQADERALNYFTNLKSHRNWIEKNAI